MPVLCKTTYYASLTLQNRTSGFKLRIGNDSWSVVAAELWRSALGDRALVGINPKYAEGRASNLVLWIVTCQELGLCHGPAYFTAVGSALVSTPKVFSIFQ